MKILYAIYHKPTDKYMPAKIFRHTSNGWTWWEPTNIHGYGGSDANVPRLFSRKASAKQAMNYWLKGNYKCSKNNNEDYFTTSMDIIPPYIPRNPKDVEIHAIELIFKKTV